MEFSTWMFWTILVIMVLSPIIAPIVGSVITAVLMGTAVLLRVLLYTVIGLSKVVRTRCIFCRDWIYRQFNKLKRN